MSTANCISSVERIGEVAGAIWHLLNEQGPLSVTRLTRDVDAPRDVILEALGWLAREDKIAIEEEGRGKKLVSLR